eukprot:gene16573-biopygen20297
MRIRAKPADEGPSRSWRSANPFSFATCRPAPPLWVAGCRRGRRSERGDAPPARRTLSSFSRAASALRQVTRMRSAGTISCSTAARTSQFTQNGIWSGDYLLPGGRAGVQRMEEV